MVEIINECGGAFLDMLAWSEGTDNGRQKTRNHAYDVIVGGELRHDYSDHPRKLVTLNPKLKSTGAGRYQLLSCWRDAYRKQLGRKTLSEKSGRWHCSRLRSVALTYDWSWWYPSGNRPLQQYLGFTAGRWLRSVRAYADSLIAKFKEAGERSERLMYAEQSHLRDYLRLVICIIVCLSWAVNHCRDNAITYKAQRQKCQRTEAGECGNYWHADASAWCCCADAKYTKELADAKAENDALRDACCRWSSSVAHQSSLSVSAWSYHVSGVIMQPPPTGRHRWTGLFHLRERLITMQNNWKEPEVY